MFKAGDDIVVFPDEAKMVVRVRDPVIARDVRNLPLAQILQGQDQMLVSLPWCEDSCKVLQNLGVNTVGAAPLWQRNGLLIEGKYQPMTHQLFTAAFITLNPRCYVLNDPRTGKTGSLVLAADYMQRHSMITGGVLVITTVTTIPDVWAGSIQETLPGSLVSVVHGKGREAALAAPAEFYVTNYDSCRISKKAFIEAVKAGRIGAVFIDEVTHVGNPTSARHKAINEIVNGAGVPVVVGATGSPAENAETVFGMCRMINRNKLPVTTKTGWLDLVTYQYGPEPFQRKLSARAPEIIHAAMQPAVRFRKQDIIDLPPVVTQNRECLLSPEQEKARDQFKQQAVALLGSGEVVTAANGGVLHQKLMQVAQGFVRTNDKKVAVLDHKDRTKVIIDAIGETQRKVVIFCFYRPTIELRRVQIEKAGYTVGVVHGGVTGIARAKVLNDFQNAKDPHVIICHPTTTAYGTEMAAADTIIFDGPPPLGGFIYAQALERLSSAKQTASSISIIRIVGSPEEKKFYKTLDSGKEMGQFINNLFEDYARGLL